MPPCKPWVQTLFKCLSFLSDHFCGKTRPRLAKWFDVGIYGQMYFAPYLYLPLGFPSFRACLAHRFRVFRISPSSVLFKAHNEVPGLGQKSRRIDDTSVSSRSTSAARFRICIRGAEAHEHSRCQSIRRNEVVSRLFVSDNDQKPMS